MSKAETIAENILEALDGAHLVRRTADHVVFAWFGGPAVNMYEVTDDGLDCVDQVDALISEHDGNGQLLQHRLPTRLEVIGLIDDRVAEDAMPTDDDIDDLPPVPARPAKNSRRVGR